MEINGQEVRRLRDEATLSVRELSSMASVGHATLLRIEGQDRIGVLPRTVRRIAAALDVDPKTLRVDR